jgi:hypothetical protein
LKHGVEHAWFESHPIKAVCLNQQWQFIWVSFLLILSSSLQACTSKTEINMTPQVGATDFSAQFNLKTDSIWMIPEPGGQRRVSMAIEMTNSGETPIRFPVVDSISITLEDEQGRKLVWEGGQDGIIPGKRVSDPISPGDTFVFNLKCHLVSLPGQRLQLSIEDGLGSIWWIGPLEKGAYRVYATYENRSADSPDLWQGRASINPVSIQIN